MKGDPSSIHSPNLAFPRVYFLASTQHPPNPSTSKMFFNNFVGLNSGHSVPEDNNFGPDGHPLPPTNGEPPAAWAEGLGHTTATGFSSAEIENWWLAPRSEGDGNRYMGSTLLGPSGSELVGEYGSQSGPISGTNNFNAGEPHFSLSSVVNTGLNADNNRRRSRF